MKIGILQSAGIAGQIIDVAFSHPEHGDVFTPVIYSKEKQNERNVSSDLKFGNISAVVVAPGSSSELKFNGAMTVHVDEHIRVASVMEGMTDAALDHDRLVERIMKAWNSLSRDFNVSSPRLALLSSGSSDTDEHLLKPVIEELRAEGVFLFGPYDVEAFLTESMHQHFDLTLTVTDEQAQRLLGDIADDTHTRFLTGLPIVVALTEYSSSFDFDTDDLELPAHALRQAIYTVMEVCRNRIHFEEAHENPLPKLYHERRDDSDKARFTVLKKDVAEKG